jgi:hypothetical protein
MPLYEVRERREYTAIYRIVAQDAEAAGRLDGEIVEEENGGDDIGVDLIKVDEIKEVD